MYYQQFLESTRKIRSKLLEPVGKFLLRLKLTANHLTFFSFILGLTAVYFLLQNHLLFIVFAVLHLIADGLDGVLARLTKPTLTGKYFDYFADRAITFFLLLRVYFYLQDYYVISIIVFFTLSQVIYILSKFKYPVIFVRTGIIIALMFIPLFPNFIPTGTYLVAGIFIIYALLLQFKHFLRTRIACN